MRIRKLQEAEDDTLALNRPAYTIIVKDLVKARMGAAVERTYK